MGQVVLKDGTPIAFEQSGKGSAVILVDGALGSRAFGMMRPVAALLSPHFTAFTYDRHGRGESGDTPPCAIEREVEDIKALINTGSSRGTDHHCPRGRTSQIQEFEREAVEAD